MKEIHDSLLSLVGSVDFHYPVVYDSGTIAELNRYPYPGVDTAIIWLSMQPDHWSIALSNSIQGVQFRLYTLWPIGLQLSALQMMDYQQAAIQVMQTLIAEWPEQYDELMSIKSVRCRPVSRYCAVGYCGVYADITIQHIVPTCTPTYLTLSPTI